MALRERKNTRISNFTSTYKYREGVTGGRARVGGGGKVLQRCTAATKAQIHELSVEGY